MARVKTVSGNYYAIFYDRARRPKEKSYPLRTKTKRAAQRKLTTLERAFDAGEFDPWKGGYLREHVSPADAAERFLTARAQIVRESTVRTYRQQIGLLLDSISAEGDLQEDLRDVTARDLRSFIHDAAKAASTRRTRYAIVRTFFRWAKGEGIIEESPLSTVRQPKKEKKEAAFLKPEDIERLHIATQHHMETTTDAAGQAPDLAWLCDLITVAVATGLRRAELAALRWEDVEAENVDTEGGSNASGGSLVVRHRDGFKTKGNAERRVPLVGDALKTLRRMETGGAGYVFTDRRGLPIKPNRISTRFSDMAAKAGLPSRVTFHSLRHTCGAWLSMKGVPMRVIQAILGHSSISATERYSHLAPDTLDAAMKEAFG
jgi:integrase